MRKNRRREYCEKPRERGFVRIQTGLVTCGVSDSGFPIRRRHVNDEYEATEEYPMSDISAMADAERAQLHEELQGLTDEQWTTMTVCDPWTVRHIAAHLTALGNQTAPNFFKGLITSGFSFSKFVNKDLGKYNQGSNADVLTGYAQTLIEPKAPPGPKYVSLGELMCHGEDIRRALGYTGEHPAAHVEALAPLYVKTGNPIGGKHRAKGLTLRATDANWTHGEGPEVAGPGVELIRAMTGRVDGLAQCTGDGVDTMRARCT
jgi:uncharacterized protein (TIGR03083 family)